MIKNIIANFIGKFWSIISNFLFIPLYIHYLGFESYSIISFTLVITGLMAVLDGGLTATLSREFARVDNSHDEKIRVFKTLEASYFFIIGFCIIIVFFMSGIIANNWLDLNAFKPNRVSIFLKIISFDVGFQLLFRFYMGGLLGLEQQIKANVFQIGWGLLRNGIVVVVMIFVPTLEMFFTWQMLSTVFFAILIGLSVRKTLVGQYKFDFQLKIEKSVFKGIWRFSGGMFLISLVASLNTQMDKLAISKFLPIENLGYYTLALSLGVATIVIVNPISVAVLPRFTALYSAGKRNEASALFHRINLFVTILVFSIMANMAFFGKELIFIWTGKIDLAEHTFRLIPVISFAYAMLALQIIPFNIAIANGYTKIYNLLGITSIFFTLPAYWLLTINLGAIGAAYVFCLVTTISTLIYLYFIDKKFVNTERISMLYIKQMLFPLLISLSIAFGFSLIPITQNRIIAFAFIGVATITTFIISILIFIPKDEINNIFNVTIFRRKKSIENRSII